MGSDGGLGTKIHSSKQVKSVLGSRIVRTAGKMNLSPTPHQHAGHFEAIQIYPMLTVPRIGLGTLAEEPLQEFIE